MNVDSSLFTETNRVFLARQRVSY